LAKIKVQYLLGRLSKTITADADEQIDGKQKKSEVV
jgi:hypothetical protein